MIINHDFCTRSNSTNQSSVNAKTGCLLVGFDTISLLKSGSGVLDGAVVLSMPRFLSLDADHFISLKPNQILSPLISGNFDITDVAQKLKLLGYQGILRAYVENIPSSNLIRREIAALHPALDFDVIELGKTSMPLRTKS